MLCLQRWCSEFLGWNEWIFEYLLPFYHLRPVCPVCLLTSQGKRTFSSTQLLLTGNFNFQNNLCKGWVKIPVDQRFLCVCVCVLKLLYCVCCFQELQKAASSELRALPRLGLVHVNATEDMHVSTASPCRRAGGLFYWARFWLVTLIKRSERTLCQKGWVMMTGVDEGSHAWPPAVMLP